MKIASANLLMTSTHVSEQRHEISESLKMWSGPRRPNFEGESTLPRPARGDTVTLSDAGRTANAAEASEKSEDSELDGDPKLRLIRSMMELLTGRRIEIFDPEKLQSRISQTISAPPPVSSPPQAAGFGIEYDRHESYSEVEQTNFSASGSVTTADGREISFQLELSMTRAYHEESSVSLRLGDAARKVDPLVLNFSGTAAELSDQRFAFDLDSDGKDEQISSLSSGSGFLVFDRNQDGKVNNGSELFGPTSNDGFQELARLDADSNGWIDENDAAFQQLQVWTPDAAGQGKLSSLAEAGVGAIALSRIATPFDIKTGNNDLLGQIRASGIFLQEDGEAGTIQQIDLTA